MNPGKSIPTELLYELKILAPPYKFDLRGKTFVNESDRDDIVVIVRRVLQGRLIVDETIIGVVGDPWRVGSAEFLRLRSFMAAGGVIGLARELDV